MLSFQAQSCAIRDTETHKIKRPKNTSSMASSVNGCQYRMPTYTLAGVFLSCRDFLNSSAWKRGQANKKIIIHSNSNIIHSKSMIICFWSISIHHMRFLTFLIPNSKIIHNTMHFKLLLFGLIVNHIYNLTIRITHPYIHQRSTLINI